MLGGLSRVRRDDGNADRDEEPKRNELCHRERIVQPRAHLYAAHVHRGHNADEEQLDAHVHGRRISNEVREVIRERQREHR